MQRSNRPLVGQVMARGTRLRCAICLTVIFLLAGVLAFSPAYAGPETMGQSPEARNLQVPRTATLGEEQALEEDAGQADADVVEMATTVPYLPARPGEVWSSAPEAAALRQRSGFAAFNAGYQNKWAANISQATGTVRLLYGAQSRTYKNGPEAAARGFLKEASALFGLKPDLSDLMTEHVYRTPERDHVRLQQIYNGVPIVGAMTLVHATPQGRVTMVQNGYRQGLQPANAQTVAEEAATETARSDLQANLGTDAILADPKVEPLIIPYKDGYYYIWKVAVSTKNPIGYWVYHVDAESGAILYKGNEILSLKSGKGRAYKTNKDWLTIPKKVSNVSLKNMFTAAESPPWWGYLYGLHADVYDYVDAGGNAYATIFSPTYTFLFNPITQAPEFDAAHAYYQMQNVWSWWDKMGKKYNIDPFTAPYGAYFLVYPIPIIVNYGGLCNAFYDPSLLGFVFGDENSCGAGLPDLVLDNDVVRHEWTHAIMDWFGFWEQFGDNKNRYGRAMGEGNADFGAFLATPKDPYMAEVAFYPSYLRNLNNTRMYPRDVNYPPWGTPEEHYTGEIWGGYLYDLYRVLKSKALPYVYNALYYFSSTGGFQSSEPDFFDAIWAQSYAEWGETTGKQTNTIKAWGSMASRGINFWLITPYSHATNYFYTGNPGTDSRPFNPVYFTFPPYKTIKTKGNTLKPWDGHEYPIRVDTAGLKLTVTVTSKAGGAVNPFIYLYTSAGAYVTGIPPPTPTKAVLTYPLLPATEYVIKVETDNTAPRRGYYDLSITVK